LIGFEAMKKTRLIRALYNLSIGCLLIAAMLSGNSLAPAESGNDEAKADSPQTTQETFATASQAVDALVARASSYDLPG
jgi:hypothetical protein